MHMTPTVARACEARWLGLHNTRTLSSDFVLYISMQILGLLIAPTIDRDVFSLYLELMFSMRLEFLCSRTKYINNGGKETHLNHNPHPG